MEEIWNPIPGYEGIYSVSNIGNIRSEDRINHKGAHIKGRTLKYTVSTYGYFAVTLSKDGIGKTLRVHRIVMASFKGFSTLTVDHINGDKKDNRLSNLEYVTQRDNVIRYFKNNPKSSKHVGVYYCKRDKKWVASICRYRKRKTIGEYRTEDEAASAYKNYEKMFKDNLVAI